MVKRVRSMTIKEEKKDVAPGQSKNFNFTFTDYGQDTCVYIDWGVSGKSSKFGNNINTCTDTNFASAKAEGDMGLLTTQLIGNTYYAEGVYTMKATATNAYGQDYQEITFTISNIKCSKPFVYIDLAQTLAYKATKYLRSSIIRLRGMAVISCPNAVDNTKSWRLESVDSTTGQTIASIDMTGLDTDKGELYIPAKFLKIGFYKAIYTMVMLDGEAGPNTIFNNSAYTYFQVGKSDLVAIMTDGGMSEITRGSKQMVTLEPLKWSFDPDEDVGAVQGLSLSKWTCTVVTTNGDQTTCNKFSTTAQTQNVAGSALIQGYTYRLEATLTKDTRTALAVISVVINGTNPPIPVIRCTEGSVCYPRTGGYTILESGRVSLDCQCPTCNLTAAYKWSVFIEDYRWNDGWRPLKDIEVIEHSISLVSKQFTIEKTLFSRYSDETTIFRTQCSIADVAGNSSTSTSLYVNKPPRPGNCSIEPANATATPDASQLWLINCWDWYDENGIKEFQFYSMTDPDDLQKEITSIPMGASEYGVINNQKVSIPIGPSYNGYKQTVMVVVKDMFNAARTVTVAKISVFPPDKALIRQYMNSILADPTSNFFKVCKEGDQRMVTEMAASVLSGLNQDASDSKKDFSSSEVPSNMICTGYGPNDADRPNAYKNVSEDRSMVTQYEFDKLRDQRAKLRTDIVKLTGTLSCKDPISIQQCAGLLAQATAEPTEVTVECQVGLYS
ncbi:uncharacterized protein LOC131938735 [Physella acuta]|uniref:uncharacterized protein LOC131938735 n=1 Tax=Physella acuta TaxID=109671 RepID=UPI0027DCEB91|nr:uncharacterized protein LOC131938735 [Physella acuta]